MLGRDLSFPEVGVVDATGVITDTLCLGRPKELVLAPGTSIRALPPNVCDREDQMGATCVGPVFGPSYTCRQCQCNAVNALVNRHGAPAPPVTAAFPDPEPHLTRFKSEYSAVVPTYYDSWLSKWKMAKQLAILTSVDRDVVRPDGVKAFVKREAGHGIPTKARLIQGYSSLATQESFAREHTCFQKALGNMFGVDGYELRPNVFVTMASGMNSAAISSWYRNARMHYRKPTFYERDGKNWDSTMQRQHHDYKIRWMQAVSPGLAKSVEAGFVAKCSVGCKGGLFAYTLNGTVKSGHNDTTSGNSLINAMISAECLHSLGLRGHVIVLGDDMLAMIEGDFDCGEMMEAERAFGIKPEAAKFYDIGDTTFISATFLESTDGEVAFVPVLGRQLLRLWWTTNPPPERKLRHYQYSVACGLASAVGTLPVYRAFLAPTLRAGGRLMEVDKFKHSAHTVRIPPGDYLPAICRRYGLTEPDIREFESFLDRLEGPCLASHWVASVIIARDTADVTGRSPIAPPFDND